MAFLCIEMAIVDNAQDSGHRTRGKGHEGKQLCTKLEQNFLMSLN